MKHAVLHAPAFSVLRLDMDEAESILSQPGAMQAMTPGYNIEVKMGLNMSGKKGVRSGMRSLFGGESLFTVCYRAKRDAQHIMLAPDQMGEIREVDVLPESNLLLAKGSFLACQETVSFDLHYAGTRGLLATHGLFFLRTKGEGKLFLSSFGGILEQTLGEGERIVIDNRNIVAFTDGMPFESVVLTKSTKDSFLSGEGFVVRFTGPGRVIHQTRARPSTGLLRTLMGGLF
jgi:uncharacterized protein (TIGR00266 family)